MESVSYQIEDSNGNLRETVNIDVAHNAFIKGYRVVEIKTITTYTEHTKIELITYEDKTFFEENPQ